MTTSQSRHSHRFPILGVHSLRIPMTPMTLGTFLGLTLGLTQGCGAVNKLYPEREARCKVNCDKDSGARGGSDGKARESLNLPLDAEFWLSATPRTRLEDNEIAQLLVSNPFVTARPTDASYGQLGRSLGATLTDLEKKIATANSIDNETRSKKPAAECYRALFEKSPTASGTRQVYELNPGLCFALNEIQQSLTDANGSAGIKALAYEDSMSLVVPQDQLKFALTPGPEPLKLLEFGQSPSAPALPFLKPSLRALRVFELRHSQVNGVQVTTANGQSYYELAWDYTALLASPKDAGFSIIDSRDEATDAVTWTFRGQFVHASGNTRDPKALRLQQAADAVGYARVISFDNFALTFPAPQTGLVGEISQNPAPASGFAAGSSATLSGSYTVRIQQGQGSLQFTVVGLNRPCEVEVFAGLDPTQEANSLGTTDLCSSENSSFGFGLRGFGLASPTLP